MRRARKSEREEINAEGKQLEKSDKCVRLISIVLRKIDLHKCPKTSNLEEKLKVLHTHTYTNTQKPTTCECVCARNCVLPTLAKREQKDSKSGLNSRCGEAKSKKRKKSECFK